MIAINREGNLKKICEERILRKKWRQEFDVENEGENAGKT